MAYIFTQDVQQTVRISEGWEEMRKRRKVKAKNERNRKTTYRKKINRARTVVAVGYQSSPMAHIPDRLTDINQSVNMLPFYKHECG